jgi:hypothetical protein
VWRKINDEDKTITCGKLLKGEIGYGILKETGIEEESTSGKTVKIRLAGGEIVSGEIIE